MQQVVVSNYQRQFYEELNALLMDSWRVVPNTMFATTMEIAADIHTPQKYILPNGKTVKQLFSIVIERDDVR